MTYAEDWAALSSRIAGLKSAAELMATFRQVKDSSDGRDTLALRRHVLAVLAAANDFHKRHWQTIPPAARECVIRLIETDEMHIKAEATSQSSRETNLRSSIVLLVAFEAEMTHALADRQSRILARLERAFSHLRRSIVADRDIQQKWLGAFDTGEVACEKLGAAHLFAHGIWAFKADAAGARTDLIYQETIKGDEVEARAVEGLVLTEWKIARSQSEAAAKAQAARAQTKAYAAGGLGGIELNGTRFIVLVTERSASVSDVSEGGIAYRHLNIPVRPEPPSRS